MNCPPFPQYRGSTLFYYIPRPRAVFSWSANGTVKFCPAHVRMNPIYQSIDQSINQSINQSISLVIFPKDWKCARVTPLFKQGHKDNLNSYRPISVILIVSQGV